MSITADINENMLKWARESIGMSKDEAAKRAGTSREKVTAWEEGASKPTMRQARLLAEAYGRPLAVLYLEAPPTDFSIIRNFRRVAEKSGTPLRPHLQFLITDLRERQVWARDYLQSLGATKIDFVGSYDAGDPAPIVAAEMTTRLLSGKQDVLSDLRQRLNLWVSAIEEAGIFVAQTSDSGRVSIEDARGFSLVDDIAPYIFVNAADSLAGRLFTLLHELGHIVLGTSAISHITPAAPRTPSRRVERFCDSFASNVLIPEQRLQRELVGFDPQSEVVAQVREIAARLGASPLAVATRLRQKRRISESDYDAIWDATMRDVRRRPKASGGDYYRSRPYQVSKRFIRVAADAYQRQQILGNQLSRLTGVKLNKFAEVLANA